jgi:hypothetical protein
MLTITLGEARLQAQQRADMVNSTFVSTAEWNTMINASYAELYDLLIGVYEDYKITSANISVLPNTDTYSLPATFYKLRGVDLVLDALGNAVSLRPFNFNERNSYMFTPTWNTVGLSYLRYHMQGDSIRFVPVPNGPQTIKLWFIPAITRLSADADTLDGVNGFEEYLILDAAIKARVKEESDVQELMIQKEAMKKRIESMAPARDAGEPEKVSDVNKRLPIEFWAWPEGGA